MKQIIKRAVSALLAVFLLCGTLSGCTPFGADSEKPDAAEKFIDVDAADWYEPYVQLAYEKGFMKGTGDDIFEPGRTLTRGMFVQILYAMEGKPFVLKLSKLPFEDVSKKDWYYNAVCWAYRNGITSGMSETQFGADEPVSREQAMVFLYAYQKADGVSGTLDEFSDEDTVSDWARDAACWAVDTGIIKGVEQEDGTVKLDPGSDTTRGQAAVILIRFYQSFCDESCQISEPETAEVLTDQIPQGVSVPVLMYHEVLDDTSWGLSYLFVTPEDMRAQLQYLKDNGFETIFLSDLTHLEDYEKPVILTFDDGYIGNYTELFPLLQEFEMKATIFVAGSYVNTEHYMTGDQIREMSDSGLVSIQSHTWSHIKMDEMTPEEVQFECEKSISVISQITGKVPYAISYPEGAHTDETISVVQNYFSFAVLAEGATWVTNGNLYTIPRRIISREMTLEDFIERVTT